MRVVQAVLLSMLLVACEGDGQSQINSFTGDPVALTGGFPSLSAPPTNNALMTSCHQPAPVAVSSTIIGVVRYERISTGLSGLDYTRRLDLPARGVVVEAVDASNGQCSQVVVATGLTNASGEYGLAVPVNQSVCVQVRAQLYRNSSNGGAHWDIQITDNTNDNAAYYLVDGIQATPAEQGVRNFFAASGVLAGSSDYSQPRAAAPFAILDTLCESIATLVAVDNQVQLPPLQVHWSVDNIASSGNPSDGEIGGAFFRQNRSVDQLNNVLSVSNQIYLLGDENNNTDEYDPHVISHEFAHFVINNLSRTDALGGAHALSDHLDMRVAFDEGFADAFAGIALASMPQSVLMYPSIYRDTLGPNQAFAFHFDLASNNTGVSGWYSEPSVFSTIYNLFDDDNNSVDQLNLGFAPLYQVLTSDAYRDTYAFVTIFSFINHLKALVSKNQAIDTLLAVEDFEPIEDDFGSDENVSNNDVANVVDSQFIYAPISSGSTRVVCSNNRYGVYNKLMVRQYLLFDADIFKTYRFTILPLAWVFTGGQASFEIFQQGELVAQTQADGPGQSLTVERTLYGRYILSLADASNADNESVGAGRRCFAVSVE